MIRYIKLCMIVYKAKYNVQAILGRRYKRKRPPNPSLILLYKVYVPEDLYFGIVELVFLNAVNIVTWNECDIMLIISARVHETMTRDVHVLLTQERHMSCISMFTQ